MLLRLLYRLRPEQESEHLIHLFGNLGKGLLGLRLRRLPIFLGGPQGHGLNAEEEHPGSDEDRGEEVEGRELKGAQDEGKTKTFSENFVKFKRQNRKRSQTTNQGVIRC